MRLADVSIVLETLSLQHNAMVTAIGAEAFDLESPNSPAEQFVVYISPESNADAGRHIDSRTAAFWTGENPLGFAAMFTRACVPLAEALARLTAFLTPLPEQLWTNCGWETSVLASAYKAVGQAVPWPYWTVTDSRTLTLVDSWLGDHPVVPSTPGLSVLDLLSHRTFRVRSGYTSLKRYEQCRAA